MQDALTRRAAPPAAREPLGPGQTRAQDSATSAGPFRTASLSAAVLALQRSVGNHAVNGLLQRPTPVVVQREWDDGGSVGQVTDQGDTLEVYRWQNTTWDETAPDGLYAFDKGVYWLLDEDSGDFTGECYVEQDSDDEPGGVKLVPTRAPRRVKLRQPMSEKDAIKALTLGGSGKARGGGGGAFGRYEPRQNTDKYSAIMFSPTGSITPNTMNDIAMEWEANVTQFRPAHVWAPSGGTTPQWIQTPGGTQLTYASKYGKVRFYTNRPGARNTSSSVTVVALKAQGRPLPPNTNQKVAVGTLSLAKLNNWAGRKRKPDQKTVMGGVSARQEALHAGYDADEGRGWQWLHLIAHSMGGDDRYGPQSADNLVAGTEEANTEMIVVEETIKNLLVENLNVDRIDVIATATLRPNTHVATEISYQFTAYHGSNAVGTWMKSFKTLERYRPFSVEENILKIAASRYFQ